MASVDSRSGFCNSNSTFYSKRTPISLPSNPSLDITTFISSQAHRGHIAFIDASTGKNLTFSELWRAVESVADCLSEMGIRKGHVVLLLSPNQCCNIKLTLVKDFSTSATAPNSILFPVVCLSVMSLGAVITTTNPLNTSSEIAKQIKDSKPVLAFTTVQLLPKIVAALGSEKLPIVLMDEERVDSVGEVRRLVEMMKKEPSGTRVRERVDQDDTATLLYSSGTTGMSKGVVSSHRNLIAMVQTVVNRFRSDDEQRFICTVPMFHIYGLAAFATGLIAFGLTIVVLSKFDMHEMMSAIEKYQATYLPLVPPILVAMINDADQINAKYDLSSLRTVLCGGAPLSKEVTEGFMDKYPTVKILQAYGLTESTAMGASTDTVEESRVYGTAGKLSASMEGRIVDPVTGQTLGPNHTGELWLKGPSIMKGYFCNEEATRSTLDSEGWLRTGDLCYINEDGFIFVVDRLKELIKYKGYQVPPAELEALLLIHPEIVDAAVIPFPDKKVGQIPMAYVVRKTGSFLTDKSIMEFVAKQVAPYKRVRKVAFVSSIPKNPSGKILRKDLIKLATSNSKL